MSKSLRKVFLLTIICAFFVMLLAITANAEIFTLYYYNGDYEQKDKVQEEGGTEITLRTEKYSGSSNTFFGWVTDDGVLYAPGAKITLTRDMKVYEASGKVSNNETELLNYFKESNWTYIKMGRDMTLTQQLSAASGWQVHVLDLNGHTLNISNCQYATGAERNGVIFFGEGTINFTSNNTANGAFYGTKVHGYGDMDWETNLSKQCIWVGKNVTINSNVPLMRMENSAAGFGAEAMRLELWGKIKCEYILRSVGLNEALVNVYPGAELEITGTTYPLIHDISASDDVTLCKMTFYGGKITLPDEFAGWYPAGRDKCFEVDVQGGTINIDVAKFISVDYKTVQNTDGTYSVVPNTCPSSPNSKHKYLANAITVTCTEDGQIFYKCDYCDGSYVADRFALGHNVITIMTSDMSVGGPKKGATPGIYTNTCARCNTSTFDYVFPDPASTYVKIKVRYEREGKKYVETFYTKASNLFDFSTDSDSELEADTYLTSYGCTSLTYINKDDMEVTLKQHEIVGIEIPLGTTKIYGGWYNDTKGGVPLGLFYKNTDIEEVYLPMSLQRLEQAVFQDMPNLKLVTGVEYISEQIGTNAFAQSKANAHLVFDTLKVNAKIINDGAFKNALATRIIIGTDVKSLGNAFALDAEIAQIESDYDNKKGMLKEIFVEDFAERYKLEDNPDFYGRTLSQIWSSIPDLIKSSIFTSFNAGSALLTKANVYFDHKYDTVIHDPTCLEDGYTAYECLQCGLSTKSDFVSHEGITHVWERSKEHDVAPTCSKEGYTAEFCKICNSVQKLETIPRNNKHNWDEGQMDYNVCTSIYYYIRRRCIDCKEWSQNYIEAHNTDETTLLTSPLGHNFIKGEDGSEIVQIPATCGTPGKSIKTCERCLSQEVVETEPTGVHHMQRNDAQRVAPTCASPGYNYFYCANCPATETKQIPQLSFEEAEEQGAHIWTDVIIFEPTTKREGMKERICSLCKTKQGNEIFIPRLQKEGLEWWVWTIIAVGAVLVAGAIFLTVYFTVFKKNNASKNYKYKFNTLKK